MSQSPRSLALSYSVIAALLALPIVSAVGNAAELKLLSPQAMRPVLSELIPQFEHSSGRKVTISYASADALAKRIETGEEADLSILSPRLNEQLQASGKIVAGSSAAVAKLGFGIIVRKGAPKPDVSSAEALKRSFLAAGSIASGDPGTSSSGRYFATLVERLGISAPLKSKIKTFPSGTDALAAIAKGEAEMVLEVISAANGPGLELGGPLPAELQSFNVYAAGVLMTSNQVEAAKTLISFISSPASAAVMKTRGFDPP